MAGAFGQLLEIGFAVVVVTVASWSILQRPFGNSVGREHTEHTAVAMEVGQSGKWIRCCWWSFAVVAVAAFVVTVAVVVVAAAVGVVVPAVELFVAVEFDSFDSFGSSG